MEQYVKLIDVQNIFNSMYDKMWEKNYLGVLKLGLMEINSLDSINDPVQVLNEMKEEFYFDSNRIAIFDMVLTKITN